MARSLDPVDRSLEGASVLVVGGAGFVGANLLLRLIESPVQRIVVVDNLISSIPDNVPNDPRISFYVGSIADPEVIARLDMRVDYAWHLACFHGNQSSIANPFDDLENGTLASLRLFDFLSRHTGVRKVVYAGAGCAAAVKTFDEPEATHEESPISLEQDSPYSISKLTGEMYGRYFHKQFNLPYVCARFQNVYGPGEILGAGNWRGTPATVWRNVVPTFIWKAIHGEVLSITGDGSATRDFVYVSDICRGLLACAVAGEPGRTYNLASGQQTAIRDLARTIIRLADSSSRIEVRDRRPWDTSGRRFGSTVRSEHELGFKSRVSIEEGLAYTIGWTREHELTISRCVSQHSDHMDNNPA